jgi:hypothetical protein
MTEKQPLPRGIRNNNPGNIRHSGAHWDGRSPLQQDANFVTFNAPEYGVRAIARILINYQTHHNLNTTEQIIHRWAPPGENLTDAYVHAVARAIGMNPTHRIDLRNNGQLLSRFVSAIIDHENGVPHAVGRAQWYDREVIDRGVNMATQSPPQHHEDRSHRHQHKNHQHKPVPPPRIILP